MVDYAFKRPVLGLWIMASKDWRWWRGRRPRGSQPNSTTTPASTMTTGNTGVHSRGEGGCRVGWGPSRSPFGTSRQSFNHLVYADMSLQPEPTRNVKKKSSQ